MEIPKKRVHRPGLEAAVAVVDNLPYHFIMLHSTSFLSSFCLLQNVSVNSMIFLFPSSLNLHVQVPLHLCRSSGYGVSSVAFLPVCLFLLFLLEFSSTLRRVNKVNTKLLNKKESKAKEKAYITYIHDDA